MEDDSSLSGIHRQFLHLVSFGINALLGGPKNIVLTGTFPFYKEDLARILRPFHYVSVEENFETFYADYVIIGRNAFDKDLIVELVGECGVGAKYLPQEALVDQLLFGADWYENADWLIELAESHPGLQFLQSLEYCDWPSTEAPESTRPVSSQQGEYREETPLHALGYMITGMTDNERRYILEHVALPTLGLRQVANTIASLIRTRKAQVDGRTKFANAIAKWESDLDWLKRSFYKSDFRWPDREI